LAHVYAKVDLAWSWRAAPLASLGARRKARCRLGKVHVRGRSDSIGGNKIILMVPLSKHGLGIKAMNKKISLVLISAGISILLMGFFVTFFWMKGNIGEGDYDVEGGATLILSSGYLEKGDRTEGGFTVSGGNEEVKFYIKNPSGATIHDAGIVKSQYDCGFTAQETGIYSFYFENLETLNNKQIRPNWRSPYEPMLNLFDKIGLLTMLGGIAILVYGSRTFKHA